MTSMTRTMRHAVVDGKSPDVLGSDPAMLSPRSVLDSTPQVIDLSAEEDDDDDALLDQLLNDDDDDDDVDDGAYDELNEKDEMQPQATRQMLSQPKLSDTDRQRTKSKEVPSSIEVLKGNEFESTQVLHVREHYHKQTRSPAPSTTSSETDSVQTPNSENALEIGMEEYVRFERVRRAEERKSMPFAHIRYEVEQNEGKKKKKERTTKQDIREDDELSVGNASGSSSVASSVASAETADLLERAHDRLHLQQLQDEVVELKRVIERKNAELESLSGQLRRAVATKCDLVLAHTELERHHEFNLRRKDHGLSQLKKENLSLLESQSEMEKELLNEIIKVTEQLKETEQKHRDELADLDRRHRNETTEKDFQIAKLKEEIRRLRHNNSPSGPGIFNFTMLKKN